MRTCNRQRPAFAMVGLAAARLRPTLRLTRSTHPQRRRVERSAEGASSTARMCACNRSRRSSRWWGSPLRGCDPPYGRRDPHIRSAVGWNAAPKARVPPAACARAIGSRRGFAMVGLAASRLRPTLRSTRSTHPQRRRVERTAVGWNAAPKARVPPPACARATGAAGVRDGGARRFAAATHPTVARADGFFVRAGSGMNHFASQRRGGCCTHAELPSMHASRRNMVLHRGDRRTSRAVVDRAHQRAPRFVDVGEETPSIHHQRGRRPSRPSARNMDTSGG